MPHSFATPAVADFSLDALRAAEPVLWASRVDRAVALAATPSLVGPADVAGAVARFRRCAPALQELFPELRAGAGVIESALRPVPRLQAALGLPPEAGTLLVKGDHALPVAGSIKARGGIHEVLEHAEALAMRHGIDVGGDPLALVSPAARALFATHEIAVGSTGNLGLSIGVMAAALGFRAVVHMSADAKEWKKERLRRRGVTVVEHAGDYAQAVAAGREAAAADPRCHFVDDERSLSLLLGYAAAAPHLAAQLAMLGRPVDAGHPLFVYLPCGVGGAPGGIALGLAQHYGPHAHCVFVEPTRSPCFLVQMLAGTAEGAHLGPHPSVYDIGLDNRTEADGLAVPRASLLAAAAVAPLLAGVCTVDDEALFPWLELAAATEDLRIEPSAAAGLGGPALLLGSADGRDYLARHGIDADRLARSTHIAWATGGLFVPDDEYARFRARGAACLPSPILPNAKASP
jgi:D-serine dehydratase